MTVCCLTEGGWKLTSGFAGLEDGMTTQTDGKAAFEEAIDHAKQSGMVVDGFVPGDDTDIAALEIRLGVRLPPSYKAVVR